MNVIHEPRLQFRSIWISDIHLGTRGCNADMLLDFLRQTESDYLYLVGDIIDFWRLRKTWYWKQTHNDVIQKILRKARKGTRIIYIPGNHDENFRDFTNHRFGRVAVLHDTFHTMVDGRKFLVMHGDHFDGVVKYAKWLAYLGDTAYVWLLNVNTWMNYVRRKLGFSYWSLSGYLKHKVKNAVEFVSNYENAVVSEARRRGADGVICGHIHTAEIREIDGIVYCNDGDWVESCTALVEHFDGRLEILRWSEVFDVRQAEGAAGSEPAKPAVAEHGMARGSASVLAVQRLLLAETERAGTARVDQECGSASSRMPGFLKSMALFARSTR